MKRKHSPLFRKSKSGGRITSQAAATQLGEIRNLVQTRQYARALTRIDESVATAANPNQKTKLLSQAADCLYDQGKYADAANAYRDVSQTVTGTTAAWVRPAIGQIQSLLKNVQTDEAASCAATALKTAVQLWQAYNVSLTQAQALLANGGQAVIPEKPPSPVGVASRLGKLFLAEGELGIAKSFFDQALQLNPNANRAKLGLAQIALRNNDPATATQLATSALKSSHFHAKTLSAWSVLLAAGRLSGTDAWDGKLIAGLAQATPSVRARAVLLLASGLRGQNDKRWLAIAGDWLSKEGSKNPSVAAELKKLTLANAKRGIGSSGATPLAAAQDLLTVTGISPSEWLAAKRTVVTQSLPSGQAIDVDALITQGVTAYGSDMRASFTYGLALASAAAGRADLAIPLLRLNASNSTDRIGNRSQWMLALWQGRQGDHAGAAQSYLSYSQNPSVPRRFQLYALVRWVGEIAASNQPDLIAQFKPQIKSILPTITDFDLVLNLARQINVLHDQKNLGDFGWQIYDQGKQLALQAFNAAGQPALAINILYKLSRRASYDFHDGKTVIDTWTQLPDAKKQWLWSENQDYWHYLELVFRAYRDAQRYTEAEQFIDPLLGDPATPPQGYAILGASYGTMKRLQGDFTTMYATYTKMTQLAPAHEWTAPAYYWLGLQAWKQGDSKQSSVYADKLLLAIGNNFALYWKRDLAAKAWCIKAGLNLSQIPAQTNIAATVLAAQLNEVQADLAALKI